MSRTEWTEDRVTVIDKNILQKEVMYDVGGQIILSDSINSKRRLWQKEKDIGAEYNLINNLGFNLCIVLWFLVMRLVAYFTVKGKSSK